MTINSERSVTSDLPSFSDDPCFIIVSLYLPKFSLRPILDPGPCQCIPLFKKANSNIEDMEKILILSLPPTFFLHKYYQFYQFINAKKRQLHGELFIKPIFCIYMVDENFIGTVICKNQEDLVTLLKVQDVSHGSS